MIDSQDIDIRMMKRVLKLAEQGLYTTKPNPRVGTIIARGEEIVAESWHTTPGQAHAEVKALQMAGDRARGADLYVNLEPCTHFGLTGPCVPAVIDAGIRRVIIGMEDPDPRVAGSGINALRKAGVQLALGTEEAAAQQLNIGFMTRMLTGRPFVRVKLAATIDGRTAAPDGSSQWITSDEARRDVHHWRAASAAVITGMGTICADDPRLNARIDQAVVQPCRVVLDSVGRLSSDASLFTVDGPVLVVTNGEKNQPQRNFDSRTESLYLPNSSGNIDLEGLLLELGRRGCNDVLVEAGATLVGKFVSQSLVDEYLIYLSPDILGNKSRGMFDIVDITNLDEKITLEIIATKQLGRDLRVRLRSRRKK